MTPLLLGLGGFLVLGLVSPKSRSNWVVGLIVAVLCVFLWMSNRS